MRRFTAVIVAAALMLSISFSGTPVRTAEGSWKTVALLTALVAEVGVLIGLQKGVNSERESILKITENLQNRAIIEQQFDTTMYAHDHRALSQKTDPAGITNTLSALYSDLTAAGGVSFAPGGDMERFLTGRAAPSPYDFHGGYRQRAESLSKYALGVMNGNDGDMRRLGRYQAEALEPMLDALFAGDGKSGLKGIWKGEHDKMQKFHGNKLPYAAADPGNFKDFDKKANFLGDEILTGPGYRRTIQASGQVSDLKNHLMTGIRASLARQEEAGVKYGHNEQQERADTHFAFEGAVGSWRSVNGTGY